MALIMHRARNRGVIGVRGGQGTWFSQGPAINSGAITVTAYSMTFNPDTVNLTVGGGNGTVTMTCMEHGQPAVGETMNVSTDDGDVVSSAAISGPTDVNGQATVTITPKAPGSNNVIVIHPGSGAKGKIRVNVT